MQVSGDGAERLYHLYVKELQESLRAPVEPKVSVHQIQALIRAAERLGPGTAGTVDAATWIWSDLHLGHEPSRVAFRRPFRSAAEADQAMMETWEQHVGERESIICLGDVSVDGDALDHHQEWWAKNPGRKWLVLGNHDVDPVNRRFEADRRDVALYADGEPPLLLTHVPLRDVPAGAVNVHGHLHLQEPPTEDRHLSVCVEQLNYRPVRLSDIRRLARLLAAGRPVPGHSTRSRLNWMEQLAP